MLSQPRCLELKLGTVRMERYQNGTMIMCAWTWHRWHSTSLKSEAPRRHPQNQHVFQMLRRYTKATMFFTRPRPNLKTIINNDILLHLHSTKKIEPIYCCSNSVPKMEHNRKVMLRQMNPLFISHLNNSKHNVLWVSCKKILTITHTIVGLGVIFLQFNDEVKRSSLPTNLHSMEQVKGLFLRSFPNLSHAYLNLPNVKIYIQETLKSQLFYELDDLK